MSTKKYVDKLFNNYEDTPALADFKEELQSNLDAKIANLVSKEMSAQAAFDKATRELGDISVLADEISFKKKQEVFSEAYLKTKSYMSLWQKIGYTLAGGLVALGILLAVFVYLVSGETTPSIGTLIVFCIPSLCGFVFLGLTQETAKNNPMPWQRALVYTVAVGVILFGFLISALLFFETKVTVDIVVAPLIPFVLPGSVILAFLLLTEQSRHKPWFAKQQAEFMEQSKQERSEFKHGI